MHVSLDSLELLGDPQITPGSEDFLLRAAEQPPPFLSVAKFAGEYELNNLSLFNVRGMPHLAVVQQPDEIRLMDLTLNSVSAVVCSHSQNFPGEVSTTLTWSSDH